MEDMHHRVITTNSPDEETAEGRIRNPEAVRKIRDTWIYDQVRGRAQEFTVEKESLLFVGTWNVNAKGSTEDDLREWLCADWQRAPQPDLIVVGFQEIVDLNAVNVAVDNKTVSRAQFWQERLETYLRPHSYIAVTQKSMVGLLITVFSKQEHVRRVKHVNTCAVGVGVMGLMGNKGGVAVRLQWYDSHLAFVCSHLAAHRENVVGRNNDFATIYSKTAFDIGDEAIRDMIRSGSLSHFVVGTTQVKLMDHDHVFWLGDLNYRIDESMPTETVLKLSEQPAVDDSLRKLDQLNLERAAGRVFKGFEEGPIHFAPTYKYQPGTHLYEQRPDKKLRAPAWCDRILFQSSSRVQQLSYNRAENPACSDHKAVYSTSRIVVKDVIPSKREAVYTHLQGILDRYENETLPTVGLDKVALDFGAVRYEETMKQTISITNTGSVVAAFRLVAKPEEASVCKRWLSISPAYGMLIPGDPSATLEICMRIDNTTAHLLNAGRQVLDDILILRLENGRDYYITVKASYARSCFGMSVDDLVMYSEPMRKVPLDPVSRGAQTPASALCIPKELWRIIDALSEKGLAEPHLFSTPGNSNEVREIRESLDTGAPFGKHSIHSYAEILQKFLISFSAPIVPMRLFPVTEIDSQTIQATARRLLEELPPIHYNVFVYVISFFREVLAARDKNGLTAAAAARICSSSLAPSDEVSEQKRTGMQLIMLHLLETSSI